MKIRFVLDAWAVLALLQKEEPAASRVRQLLEDAEAGSVELFISIINLGEVVYRIGKTMGETEAWETLHQLRRLPLTAVPATQEAVFDAVGFKMHHAISYADAFAAATSDSLNAVLVTGDPELARIRPKLQIEELKRNR
ncbi:type II toxin-antitoxin system VapC family toxin [Chloroflexota bacterium]